MRWLEQVQHDMDLLIIDEADAVQQVLDARFVQDREAGGSGEDGWTHRMAGYTNNALAGMSMAPAVDPEVQQWHELPADPPAGRLHAVPARAVPGREALRDLLGDATFTAHSLFRQAARMLFGLPRQRRGRQGRRGRCRGLLPAAAAGLRSRARWMTGRTRCRRPSRS